MKRDSGAAVYEFFAGGGMARIGLGSTFEVTFANDIDPAKAKAYVRAHGEGEMRCADVWNLTPADLPGRAALAWASFPCQDLSLAGARGGMAAPRSGAFWGFWRLMQGLAAEGRAPDVLVLENVMGLLTSRGGADFAALADVLAEAGYVFGALALDAADFVPQSRPRLFVVAARRAPDDLIRTGSDARDPEPLRARIAGLTGAAAAAAVWWDLPPAPVRNVALEHVIDEDACGVCWNTPAKTQRLLDMMAPRQRAAVETRRRAGGRHVGALFRRIRIENGMKVQRAEARFDGLAGCLRTPAGGSSRQTLLIIDEGDVRSRLVSPREAARLMGLPEDYPLPDNQTAALHLLGDGVAVPVVRHLAEHLLAQLVAPPRRRRAA